MNDNKKLQQALASFAQQLSFMNKVLKKYDHAGRKKSGKTRRGAKHILGTIFLGRKIFKGTPAEYRRAHRGRLSQIVNGKKVKIIPNYMKPSPKPRARNCHGSSTNS